MDRLTDVDNYASSTYNHIARHRRTGAPTDDLRERLRMTWAFFKLSLAMNIPGLSTWRNWSEGSPAYTLPIALYYQLPSYVRGLRESIKVSRRCWSMNAWRNSFSAALELLQQRHLDCISLAQLLFDSMFDEDTIEPITTQAHRLCLYDSTSGSFTTDLKPHTVRQYMTEHVPAFCFSYKHTRKDRNDIDIDQFRLFTMASKISQILQRPRLLFWSDVIGETRGNWAQQGIEPYLMMPTVRVVSNELDPHIKNSFWMHVERQAAAVRPGMLTFDEDNMEFVAEKSTFLMSTFSGDLNKARWNLAKLVLTPAMFHLKTLWEKDRIRILDYAVKMIEPKLRQYPTVDDVLMLHGVEGLTRFLGCVLQNLPLFFRDMPEKMIETSELPCPWCGIEEMLPAVRIVDDASRYILNQFGRDQSNVLVLSTNEDVTELLIGPYRVLEAWTNIPGSILRMHVKNYEETDDSISGSVLRYRVARPEEEELIRSGDPVHKEILFDKMSFISVKGECLANSDIERYSR